MAKSSDSVILSLRGHLFLGGGWKEMRITSKLVKDMVERVKVFIAKPDPS